MSGECRDCGNAVCVCRELEKQPDISNCILVDKCLLKEMKDEIASLKKELKERSERIKDLEDHMCDICLDYQASCNECCWGSNWEENDNE